MLAYWLLFGLFAVGALWFAESKSTRPLGPSPYETTAGPRSSSISMRLLTIAAVVPVLMIGLRYDVGTDYGAYVDMFEEIKRGGLAEAVLRIDPAYGLLNWFAAGVADFWLVNMVCGILFVFGLVRFAKMQPNPWLAITVAVPYLVIAVAMGYSRQAVAIALSMVGLVALTRGSFARFVYWVLAGALFHRTAVILIPIVAVAYSRNRFQAFLIAIVGSLVGYYLLTQGQGLEHFQRSYVSRTRESSGAAIRLAMNLTPGLIYLAWSRRFTSEEAERRTWRVFAIVAVLSFFFYFLITSSTALDRMALYVIPLQLFVLSRVPSALSPTGRSSNLLVMGVILYSAAVQFVWLNYSANAANWIPYKIYPLF